jgi:hypothetical protein
MAVAPILILDVYRLRKFDKKILRFTFVIAMEIP